MPRANVLTPPTGIDPAHLPGDVRLMNGTASLLLTLLAVALAAVALHWAVRLPAFAIRAIEVDGEVARNSVQTIRAIAMPRLAGTFFTLDLRQAQHAFESVPWVRHAVLRRVWPNRLAVRLEEHRAAALWGEGDEPNRLVNPQGEVFEANLGDVEDDHLPTLQGPAGSAPQVLAMFGRLKPVFARLDTDLETLTLSGRGSWRAELANGATVEMGRGSDDEVVARTERFVATVPQMTARYERRFEHADLRHSGGYALRLPGVTTVAAPAPAAAAPRARPRPQAAPAAARPASRPAVKPN